MARQDVTVEIFYSAAWHDVSSRWRVTKGEIVINHSAGNEETGVVPSDASLTFDNRDGEMNPENRKSSLFGLIGHNTPIRITVGSDTRFSGQIVSWKPRRAIKGDAWVEVKAQGTIRRLGQGEPPVQSAMFRTFIGVAPNDYIPHAYWPMEDDAQATQFASAIAQHPAMVPAGDVDFGAESSLAGSSPLPTFSTGSTATAIVPAYATSTQWVVMFALLVPSEPASKTTYAEFDASGGTETLWRVVVDPSFSPAVVDLETYNSSGTLVNTIQIAELTGGSPSSPTEAEFFGTWATYVIASEDTGGSNISHWAGLTIGSAISVNHLGTTDGHGAITGVRPFGGNGASHGHYAVYVDPNFTVAASDSDADNNAAAMGGWVGETAGARFARLCDEESITGTIVGTAADTQLMGPQYPDTLLNLFDETARTDAGSIHDTRGALGLTFRTGRSLYNQ